IDGEGIPGPVAMSGYYLIFEIFIRPILIVVGLIAAVSVFAAQVEVLHIIWPEVIDNVTGHSFARSGISGKIFDVVSQFFYMVLYAIVVYMMGMASFKLIDLIPHHILRWIGTGISGFTEYGAGPVDQFTNYAFWG